MCHSINSGSHEITFSIVEWNPGGWILAASPCVLAWVYTSNSLLIKDIKRLWPIHTVQTSNMQYAFGVQVYGEVLYLKFYSVFSEPFINDEILPYKNKCTSSWENGILHTIKKQWILIVIWKTNSPYAYFQKSPPSTVIYRLTFGSEVHGLYN